MTLLLGAVAYDPKVVTIWEGFKTWSIARGLDFDYVLYSNYERQVEQHHHPRRMGGIGSGFFRGGRFTS